MQESDFWEIIDQSRTSDQSSPDEQCEVIADLLSVRSKHDLISFSNVHKELLRKAYTWPMLKACMIVIHYVSDDVFEDFRNWVILSGENSFYQTLVNPDSLSEVIDVTDPIEEVTGEALLYVVEEAWDGEIEELEEQYIYPDDPVLDCKWPAKSLLEREYPKIYARFWDDSVEYGEECR